MAQQWVARAHRWPELMVRAKLLTSAAYSTGTIAIANGGVTWTLTGGTFPTDVASGLYRIALSVSDPWYGIVTRTSGTEVLTTGSAYQEDTETASPYIVYKSHISLPSAVDRVEEMWLLKGGEAVKLENAATDTMVTDFTHFPTGIGVPTHFYMMERDASGNRQILLGPTTPDDVYQVEYVYRKKITAGTLSLDDARFPIILAKALSLAYAPEFYDRSLAEEAKANRLLREEIGNESEVETQSVRIGQNRVDFPAWDMGSLLGRGHVEDPT